MNLTIEAAVDEDFSKIWEFFSLIVKLGDTVSFSPDITYDEAKKFWMGHGHYVYKAMLEGAIIGTYVIRAIDPGPASHVANGIYMVHPDFQGKKIGFQMVSHSLREAKSKGFKAMQFSRVVCTNIPAIKLYQKMGFKIVGTLPKAFNHKKLGFVDAYIMHRFL